MTEQESEILKAIEEGRVVKTKGGLDVRIYATDGGGKFPIHGAIRASESEPWVLRTWTGEGRHQLTITTALDLVIGPRTIEVDLWINVYGDRAFCFYSTKEQADKGVLPNRFACINIKRTVTKGEGL